MFSEMYSESFTAAEAISEQPLKIIAVVGDILKYISRLIHTYIECFL